MEGSHRDILAQVTSSEIGIVTLKKIFISRGDPMHSSIYLSPNNSYFGLKNETNCSLL